VSARRLYPKTGTDPGPVAVRQLVRPSGRGSVPVFGQRLVRKLASLFGLAACLVGGVAHAEDVAPLGRFDLAPYRVTVRVTFGADPSVTPAFRKSVLSSLTARIRQSFGPTWNLLPADRQEVEEDDTLTPADESGLGRLTYAAVAGTFGTLPLDKAYLLVVRPQGEGWLIAGREWDRTLETLGPLLTARTIDRRAIADAGLALLQRLFSPLLIVNDASRDSKVVTLTVRAGSIPPADPRAAPLKKGALFVPVFRFLDSKGNVRKIQPVPWTYLVLDEVSEGHAKCTLASSFRAPLAANMRRRVEAVAVLVRPEFPETHLRLVVGREARRPLAGMFVDVRAATPEQAQKNPSDRQELLSDRRGAVVIAANPRRPLQWIQVHSGAAVLARRPFVPGVEAEATLQLADDEIRLNTQRDVDLLRVQLIETVARRAAITAHVRASLKTDDTASTQRLLGEMEHLPTAETYLAKLNEIRVLALEEAGRRKDRVSERRIDDLCEKTRGLIEQYLPDDRLQTLRDEVNAAATKAAEVKQAVKDATITVLPLQKKAKSKSKAKSKPVPTEPTPTRPKTGI
jgi:hypothetical protein